MSTQRVEEAGPPPFIIPDARPTSLPAGELEPMFREYGRTHDPRLREILILRHQRLVVWVASRFANQGEAFEDLVQEGNIGLIKAVDRYKPIRGARFSTYATTTIVGEIKRYLRDKTNRLKIPRWLQENQQIAQCAMQQMTDALGRSPTVLELAAHLHATEEHTLEVLATRGAINVLSLDTQGPYHKPIDGLKPLTSGTNPLLNDFEIYADLRRALACLQAQEQQILRLRFFEEMSQAKIARTLGISQMQVSRLQHRALKRLRGLLADDHEHKPPLQARTPIPP